MDLKLALGAGFLATYIATIGGYWFPAIGLPKVDFAIFNGVKIAPGGSGPQFSYLVGMISHLIDGVIFGLIYAWLISPRLRWAGWLKGMIFGFILTVAVWLAVLPLVFEAGLFGAELGWKATIAVLAWHLIWGVLMGAIYDDIGIKNIRPRAEIR